MHYALKHYAAFSPSRVRFGRGMMDFPDSDVSEHAVRMS